MNVKEIVSRMNCEPDWYGNAFFNLADSDKLDEIAEAFIKLADTTGEVQVRLAEAEKCIIASTMAYLYFEAPPEEQNCFMLCELLRVGKISNETAKQYQDNGWDLDSDLDRLYKLLAEKNDEHIALKLYATFKSIAGDSQNAVLETALRHLWQYSLTTSTDFFDFLREHNAFNDSSNMAKIAKALVSMMVDEKAFLKKSDDEDIAKYFQSSEYLFISFVHYTYYNEQISSYSPNDKVVSLEDFIKYARANIKRLDTFAAREGKKTGLFRNKKQSSEHPALPFYSKYKETGTNGEAECLSSLALVVDFFQEF